MEKLKSDFTKYVGFNVLGMLGMSCYILADTFFIAKALGTVGLASLNFSISVFSIIQGFGLMIGIGASTKFSIIEQSNRHERNLVFTNSLIIGGIISIFFITIAIFLTEQLSILLGADGVALPLTKIYLTIILSFAPFFILNNIMLSFIRNDKFPQLSMIAMLTSSMSNIILDYVFMFPLSMGIFGAAFATGLSPVISLCILSFHIISKKNTFHIIKCRLKLFYVKTIMFLGFSSLMGELASAISLIVFNIIISKIEGNTGVAAYGVIANIALIATAMFVGISQGLQPLASKYYGRGNKVFVNHILHFSITTSFMLSLFIYVIVFIFAKHIVNVFNSENDIQLSFLATEGIKIYFIGYFFAGINIISSAFLSAISKSKYAMAISMLRSFIILVPFVFIFTLFFNIRGIWLSFVITEFVVFIITMIFLSLVKK